MEKMAKQAYFARRGSIHKSDSGHPCQESVLVLPKHEFEKLIVQSEKSLPEYGHKVEAPPYLSFLSGPQFLNGVFQ